MYIKQISDDLRTRCDQVTKLIAFCEEYLAKCPDGRLRINKRGDLIYYYHVTVDGKKGGIRITDTSIAETLAQKSYMKFLLKTAREEQRVLNELLNHYETNSLESVYDSYSDDRKSLIRPFSLPDQAYIDKWLNTPYIHKEFKEGTPVFTTLKGERVRSKSEQLIADRLYLRGIPYKYECPLIINGQVFHPDFTILRVSDRQVVYYEHLGRMDDPDYASDTVNKIKIYELNGYVIGANRFTTMESSTCPLDIRIVDTMIDKLFR